MMELERFMQLLGKHIDLLERRVIKGENIPHEEKMFSIFEQYTEWFTKGKCNKAEAEERHKPIFKKFRNKHSAVESNINELEHRGLNRSSDKGYPNFKRYIGLAVCAYNLMKIGTRMIEEERRYLIKQVA